MNKLPVTVIVPTKNEQKNLEQCLESIKYFEKTYVVDSFSADATPDIARDYGVQLVNFKYDGGWPKKKNWALSNLNITTPWTLILDADERVTDSLFAEIGIAIDNPLYDAYYIRWKFIFLGRWMKYSWSHGWMLRLFRTGSSYYENLGMTNQGGWDNEVHENLLCSGPASKLQNYLLHDSNQSISFWIRKQNEFSDWNSSRRRIQYNEPLKLAHLFSNDPAESRKTLKGIYLTMPFKPLLTFAYLYGLRFGFLDGKEGFIFCIMRSMHEFNAIVKMYEYELGIHND